MTALLLATTAAVGVHLVYTSVALGQRHLRARLGHPTLARRRRVGALPSREVAGLTVGLAALGGLVALSVFGRPLPAIAVAGFASTFPTASQRARERARRASAMEAWPRMLEEVRILTSSLGRSIPQALFQVGRRAPLELRPAFDAAHREWLLSTDFARTVRVLKTDLADPTADAALETLLVAHEVGGTDLDRRLAALIDDRRQDAQGRKDARAKQAGVRFARRFVLVVPAGMAVAGMSIGTGRAAYQTGMGQVLATIAIGLVVACWIWAGRIMALPGEQRVLDA